MNRFGAILLLGLAVVAGSTSAVAQSTPRTNNTMPPPPVRTTDQQQMMRFENEEQRRRLGAGEEGAQQRHSPERLELARQVAALVEQHKCDEARAMANAAGERQMALRIRRTCR